MVTTHIGNNIAKLRGFRRLPQKEVASKLQMSQQEYSKIEAKAHIDDDLLEQIAAIIDFPIELIKQMDSGIIIQNYNQQGGTSENIAATTFTQNNADKVVELYERLLKEKEEMLNYKDQVIKGKDEIIELYKNQRKAS